MIKSTDAEVRALIQALSAGDTARREAAVARLLIVGARAVGRLIAEFDACRDRDVQVTLLRVLEASGDDRSLDVARRALDAGGDLAVAAAGVLREMLVRGTASRQTEALDVLLTILENPSVERRVRSAAAQALDNAPEDVRRAVHARLPPAESEDDAIWEDALEGHLPDDPDRLCEVAAVRATTAALPVLRKLIEIVREREQREPREASRERWRRLRGALHQAVALRGSRVALYDLRETFALTAGPLPSSFVAALQVIGDESCLDALAAAHCRASAEHGQWRQQLAGAFHTVARRERLTKKHSAMRRALAKSPELALH